MNSKNLTLSLLALLCMSVITLAYLVRSPLCIDSKVVDRFDRVDRQGTFSMFSCSYRKHVPYNEQLATSSRILGPIFEQMERYFNWIGPLQEPLSLTSFEGKTNLVRLQGKQIFIGENLANNKEVLQKLAMKAWIREASINTPFERPIFEEVITDLMIYAMAGELNIWSEPNTFEIGTMGVARWPRILQTLSGYCNSSWKLAEDLQMCDTLYGSHKSETTLVAKNQDDSLVSLSLRPLLTQSMIASYEKLSSAEKLRLLSRMKKTIESIKVKSPPKIAESSLQNLTVIISELQNILQGHPETHKLASYLSLELQSRGFNPGFEYSSVDTIFFLAEEASGYLDEISKATTFSKSSMITLEGNDAVYFLPDKQAIPKKVLGDMRALRGFWLNCGMPRSTEILKYENRVEKLLIVDSCSRKAGEKIDFFSYIEGGVESFAKANKNVNFIHLHIPSLKLALSRSKQSPIELILGQVWKGMQIQNLAWKDPNFDKELNAFRMSSQIDAVDLFRYR